MLQQTPQLCMAARIGQNEFVCGTSGVIMAIHHELPCTSVNHSVPA